MENQIIMPTRLNPGMISVIRKEYDVLTNDLIQRWLSWLYNDHLIDPQYLFVSEQGKYDLVRVIENMPEIRYFYDKLLPIDELIMQYTNYATGTKMHVAVLPTLPSKTLLFGNLVLPEWSKEGLWGNE